MTPSALFNALLTAGLPLFLLTFVVVTWALHAGRLSGGTVRTVQDSMRALGASQKDRKTREKVDPVTHQWLRFGGGFYGLVALYTWLLIEWDDLASFFTGIWRLVFRLDLGAVIGLAVNLFIESIMNFVVAIAWPAYWLAEYRQPWLLLLAAYGGYWLGIEAAGRALRAPRFTGAIERARSIFRRDQR